MDKPRLSVCLIVKNEEKNLPRALASVKDVADEIIVVDTGSTDSTIGIAKKAGAKVFEHEWKDDFSEARNFALDKATGEWVLQLDADEELSPPEPGQLEELLSARETDGYWCQIVNLSISDSLHGAAHHRFLRMFRRGAFRYSGIIHEFPERIGGGSSDWPWAGLHIIHRGYMDSETLPGKIKRNLDLVRSAIERDPDKYMLYFYLGQSYVALGSVPEALEAYEKAEAKRLAWEDGHRSLFTFHIANALVQLNRAGDALAHIKRGLEIFPDYRDLLFLAGEVSASSGDPDGALYYYDLCAELPVVSPRYLFVQEGVDRMAADRAEKLRTQCQLESAALRVEFGVVKERKISVCMIALNEADDLTRAFQSVESVADEIIVAYMEASERAIKVAEKKGAKVFRHEWKDDFSEARNFALDQATGDWVLQLDADEELRPPDIRHLRYMLGSGNSDRYSCQVITPGRGGAVAYQSTRLMRNGAFRYRGIIYETPVSSSQKSGRWPEAGLKITQWGASTEEARQARRARDRTLLDRALEKDPGDFRLYWYLGERYLASSRVSEALKCFSRAETLRGDDNADFEALTVLKICDCLMKANRLSEARGYVEYGLELFPDYRDLVFLAGCIYERLRDFPRALRHYDRCSQIRVVSSRYSMTVLGLDSVATDRAGRLRAMSTRA